VSMTNAQVRGGAPPGIRTQNLRIKSPKVQVHRDHSKSLTSAVVGPVVHAVHPDRWWTTDVSTRDKHLGSPWLRGSDRRATTSIGVALVSGQGWSYRWGVATDPLELDDDLGAVVARARRRMVAAGMDKAPVVGVYRSPLGQEERDAILNLLRDGTYRRTVERIAAADPDLADQ
jgi:hypothetical protein